MTTDRPVRSENEKNLTATPIALQKKTITMDDKQNQRTTEAAIHRESNIFEDTWSDSASCRSEKSESISDNGMDEDVNSQHQPATCEICINHKESKFANIIIPTYLCLSYFSSFVIRKISVFYFYTISNDFSAAQMYMEELHVYVDHLKLGPATVGNHFQGKKWGRKYKDILPESLIRRYGKVELLKGSDLYVRSRDLDALKSKYKRKPFEIGRRLLKLIVGVDNLKTMTRTGRNNMKEIPADVYLAILGNLLSTMLKKKN